MREKVLPAHVQNMNNFCEAIFFWAEMRRGELGILPNGHFQRGMQLRGDDDIDPSLVCVRTLVTVFMK
jgi:hypothetical protein